MAEALDSGERPDPSDVTQIVTAAEKASAITQRLLGFAREAPLNPVPTLLADIVEEVLPILETLLPETVAIVTRTEEGAGVANVDPTAVEQVLVNLASNAGDAMPDGGTLEITTAPAEPGQDYVAGHSDAESGPYVRLSVADTGLGMDEETRARVFEPFFTTKGPGSGTGLGLAMVYGLVEQQGGFARVDSAPGEGTTVHIYLPAASGHHDGDEPRRRQTSDLVGVGGTETILLAEDEDAVRETGKRVLERYGYTVLEAATGREALDIFRRRPDEIDLVIADLVMPEMGGPGLYRVLQTESEGRQKVILASGYSGPEARTTHAMPPSAPFLSKPWSMRELLAAVRRVLDDA